MFFVFLAGCTCIIMPVNIKQIDGVSMSHLLYGSPKWLGDEKFPNTKEIFFHFIF